jgi:hypothetical protein
VSPLLRRSESPIRTIARSLVPPAGAGKGNVRLAPVSAFITRRLLKLYTSVALVRVWETDDVREPDECDPELAGPAEPRRRLDALLHEANLDGRPAQRGAAPT